MRPTLQLCQSAGGIGSAAASWGDLGRAATDGGSRDGSRRLSRQDGRGKELGVGRGRESRKQLQVLYQTKREFYCSDASICESNILSVTLH